MKEKLIELKERLENYPFSNHEIIMMKDSFLVLIAAFLQEKIPEIDYAQQKPGNGKETHITYANKEDMPADGTALTPPVLPRTIPISALHGQDVSMKAPTGEIIPAVGIEPWGKVS